MEAERRPASQEIFILQDENPRNSQCHCLPGVPERRGGHMLRSHPGPPDALLKCSLHHTQLAACCNAKDPSMWKVKEQKVSK